MPKGGLDLGVQQLDALLAPLPERATVLFLHEPGVDASAFLYQAAHRRLSGGGEVVWVATSRSPDAIVVAMEEHGFDAAGHAGRLHFVDAYSALLGQRSGAAYPVPDPAGPAELAVVLGRAAREHPHAALLVDSLSNVLDRAPQAAFRDALPALEEPLRRFALAGVAFTRWPYGDELALVQDRFDAVVSLRGVEDRVLFQQYFAVERAAWAPQVDRTPRLYKALKPGGVVVYIPKVLVTGPHKAGKSTFVHQASDQAASAEVRGTTVAMDHGHLTMDGMTADLFGTPGQERFDPLLRTLAAQALGVVVVVDATDPGTFGRAREMLQLTWKEGLPAVIAANKQDAPGALPPERVARLLKAPPRVRVVPCVARDPASARAVLQALLGQILEGNPAELGVAP